MKKPDKWTIWPLMLALVLAVQLAACAGGGAGSEENTSGSLPAVETSGAALPQPAEGTAPDGVLRELALEGIRPDRMGTGATEQGYYELVRWLDESTAELGGGATWDTQIWYTDYATRQQAVLCGDTGCAHSNESCSGWLPGWDYSLFAAGQGLVLVQYDSEVWQDEAEGMISRGEYPDPVLLETLPGKIYTLGLDGGGKTLVAEIEGWHLERDWFSDDEYLYGVRGISQEPQSETDYDSTRQLFRVHLRSGEVAPLYTPERFSGTPMGVLDGEILLKQADYAERPESLTNGEVWLENEKAARMRLIAVNIHTGQARTLEQDWPNWDMNAMMVYDGWLYYNINSEAYRHYIPPFLTRENLLTGEVEKFIEGPEDFGFSVEDVMGGRVLVAQWDMTGMNPDGTGESVDSWAWVPLEGGALLPVTLMLEYQADWGGSEPVTFTNPVRPIAEAADYFLVVSDISRQEDKYYEVRALISKDDYWAGRPNYLPITVME